jgi:hypothetical protein
MPAPASENQRAQEPREAQIPLRVPALLEEPADKDAEELGPHITIIQASGKPSRFARKVRTCRKPADLLATRLATGKLPGSI